MDFHNELLEETRGEIKNIQFFREDVDINAEEYEVIHDYDEAYENAFRRGYEYGEFKKHTWVDILEDSVPEEMYNEIDLCVQSRFICGKRNAFFESLFKAYKLGGWPCGWKNGKIIVYVPANK